MVILIAGASHAGKTLLAQRMLEEYGYPYLSIDHQNALWALRRVAEVWGGEVTSVITVANGRVSSRSIRLDDERGHCV